jgi:hypothetical protein
VTSGAREDFDRGREAQRTGHGLLLWGAGTRLAQGADRLADGMGRSAVRAPLRPSAERMRPADAACMAFANACPSGDGEGAGARDSPHLTWREMRHRADMDSA